MRFSTTGCPHSLCVWRHLNGRRVAAFFRLNPQTMVILHVLMIKFAAFLRMTVTMRGWHHPATTIREHDMTVQYNQQGNGPNNTHHYFIGTSMLLFILVLQLNSTMEEYLHVSMVFQAVLEMHT